MECKIYSSQTNVCVQNSFTFNTSLCIVSNSDVSEGDVSIVATHHTNFTTVITDVIFIVCSLRWLMPMEDSQAIVANRVSNVVAELTKFRLCWLDIDVK